MLNQPENTHYKQKQIVPYSGSVDGLVPGNVFVMDITFRKNSRHTYLYYTRSGPSVLTQTSRERSILVADTSHFLEIQFRHRGHHPLLEVILCGYMCLIMYHSQGEYVGCVWVGGGE